MNCLKCSQEFNTQISIPRLLPHCGHTLCEPCVKKIISSNFIVCPECGEVNIAGSENDLPKNLAILSLKQQMKKGLKRQNTNEREKNRDKYCNHHFKDLQNFCLDCCEFGCFECLVGHNKDHNIKSLQQTQYFLKDQAQQTLKKLKQLKLSYKLQKIQIQKTQLLSTINTYKTQIHSIFTQMKALCQKKQEEALNFLKGLYDVQLIRLLQQEKQMKSFIDKYNLVQIILGVKTLNQLTNYYSQNRQIFKKFMFPCSQYNTKGQQKLSELCRWQTHFNKYKQSTLKQLKQILNIKSLPVSSTTPNPIKLQVKTPKDSARFYQTKTHISIKPNKIQQTENIPPRSSKSDIALSAYTSCKEAKSVFIYGGYTDESQDSRISGVQIYGSNKLYEKYTGCIGHVKFGMFQYEGHIFILGGKVDNKRIDYIFQLSSLKDGFKISGKLVKPKSGFGYCKTSDSFIVVGGNDGQISSSCQQYSLQGLRFKRILPNLQQERDQLSLTIHKGNLYAIGGYNNNSEISLKSVQMYSFETNQWQYLPELVRPRRSHCSISLPSGLFVVGGYDGINYLSEVQRYNQKLEVWQQVFSLLQPRCTFGLVQNDQGFIVMGGFAKIPQKSSQICNTKDMKSRPGTSLSCNRFMHGCIIIGDSFKI